MGEPPPAIASYERKGRRFVYQTESVRLAVAARGRDLIIPYSLLHAHGMYDQLERIVDAWWALAPQARVDRISIAYRGGDPYETFQLRPQG
ncbi:MAG: hypothetical protein H6712_25055 [Myxococcales bacterium]|nr:hypothetical protein [Myxococcales bacterium]MCB9717145.1 hypothetical protein [Myxococcales bacterium]